MESTKYFNRILLFIMTLGVVTLLSCSLSGSVLHVKSDDYPHLSNLEVAEFSFADIKNNNVPYTCNKAYCVSEKEGALWIYDGRKGEDSKSSVLMMNNGYFVGVNLGHMDGWVRYFPYFSAFPEAGESKVVTDDYFYAFAEISYELAYLMTTNPTFTGTNQCNVYKLYFEDDVWNWEIVATFDGYPNAYYYDDEACILYVSTYKGVFSVDSSLNLSSLKTPDCWNYLGANSIVKIDRTLYFGTNAGIYAYSIDGNTAEWYPIEKDD